MLILAPFLVAYFLALVVSQPFVTLWRGTIPFVDKPWWPDRAKKFEVPRAVRAEDNSILSQMIRLREGRLLRFFAGLPHRGRACDPEYMIHTIARYVALLKRDGLSEPRAVRKIDDTLRLGALSDKSHPGTVEEYLEFLLAARCPEYLSHGPGLLTAVLALAMPQIEASLPPMGGYATSEWLTSRMSTEEFKQQFDRLLNTTKWFVPSSRCDAEYAEFLVRWQEGDELWRWSTPSWTWKAMMGRGGVAIVRDGKQVTRVMTILN